MKKYFLIVIVGVILLGFTLKYTKLTVYNKYSDDEKLEMYKEYLKELPDQIDDSSYYTIEVYDDAKAVEEQKDSFAYFLYHYNAMTQINMFDFDIEDDLYLTYNDEYAYMRIGVDSKDIYQASLDDSLMTQLTAYDIDIKDCLSTISNISIEETQDTTEDNYYYDIISFDLIINDEIYHGNSYFYVDKNKNVKTSLDDLFSFKCTNDDNILIYLSLDQYSMDYTWDIEQPNYIDITPQQFKQNLDHQIEIIKSQYD